MAILLLLAAVSLLAQNRLTPEMVVNLKIVSAAEIDPSGKNVAYVLTSARGLEEEKGGRYSELFVVPAAGGAARQYTYKPQGVSSPQWSPDGGWIYFTAQREEQSERNAIYRIALDGGEARLVASAANDITSFLLSPDGQWLAYLMTDPETAGDKQNAKIGRDVRTVDQQFKFPRLYVQAVAGGEAKALTGEIAVWSFAWSPDAGRLVVQASATPKTDDSYMFKKLYTVSRSGGELKLLTETRGKLGHMSWSPDGRHLAFLAGVDESDPTNGSIFVVAATGGAATNLTENYEGTVTWVEWINATTLAFTAVERSHTVLKTMPAQGGKMTAVISSGFTFSSASLAKDGKTFALVANTDLHPNEAFSGSLATGKLTRLSNSNPELAGVQLAGSEEISWSARDGLEITGLLMLPLNYEKGKRYPCIVQIHGGPESAYLDGWSTNYVQWGELLAANGFVVFSPNYRGSTGRGVAYAKADHKDLGGREFEDVLDGLAHLERQGLIDLSRVGIGGFSYGGYFSALAATRYSEHFRAASMGAGIANWISFTGTSDIPHENSMVHWNLSVWENMEKAWLASPMAHVQKSKTALLISHGDRDDRVPISQGREIYTALKMLGKTVEFDIYPREAHGFREVNHQLFSIKRNLEWFEKYVKGATSGPAVP
ncbi:MAG: S9 family peptidase [candidate division KSB1 bacterium]|nr:S9 family peptidase [candidate division KSB1 bacterium]MDZ7275411.1 S9 family peptidase [candidate division KSB1 bacterium]MDZ7305539.1 S9 family peptidase [candidate division KSB1 bacterium]MDZ7394773.1 S9 family peptidase [candidate division KSB1 bacterium]MDZ7408135.1 S9 family peptidase [candidate division KSB1 bacterium]